MSRYLVCLLVVLTGCDDDAGNPSTPVDGSAPDAEPALIFETDVRANYVQVRDCRHPGEHSALNAFSVWVDKAGEASFNAIWETPPAATEVADGTVIVKEIYSGEECDPSAVSQWVAMKKEPGFDPAHSNWHWQSVFGSGKVRSDGVDTQCIDCHSGETTTSCAPFGFAGGRDYICTAP